MNSQKVPEVHGDWVSFISLILCILEFHILLFNYADSWKTDELVSLTLRALLSG